MIEKFSRETKNHKETKKFNIRRRYMTGTFLIQRKSVYNIQSQQFIVIDEAATVQFSQIIIQKHNT